MGITMDERPNSKKWLIPRKPHAKHASQRRISTLVTGCKLRWHIPLQICTMIEILAMHASLAILVPNAERQSAEGYASGLVLGLRLWEFGLDFQPVASLQLGASTVCGVNAETELTSLPHNFTALRISFDRFAFSYCCGRCGCVSAMIRTLAMLVAP